MNTADRSQACRPAVFTSVLMCVCLSQTGCSLFVMAGKMFWGDPKMTSEFRQKTGINLIKGDSSLLVICSTPESVKSALPFLEVDLMDAMTRKLERQGVAVVKPDKVAKWIDDHGGMLSDVSELAEEFQPDYIAHIEIERFSLHEENSPSMLRGRASGSVVVYTWTDDTKQLSSIFPGDFSTEYPHLYPVSVDRVDPEKFQHDFVKHLSTQLSRFFYDYRIREDI